MKKRIIWILLVFIVSCNSSNPANDPTTTTDSILFGNVQPLLEQHTPGEKLVRIDSLAEYRTVTSASISIYYVTDKGSRIFNRKKRFDTVILKGYKANGAHDCILKILLQERSISKCQTAGCTLVIDTSYIAHKAGPYPVLHPGDDTLSAPCPPNL